MQRVLPHYRLPFFDALYAELAGRGMELEVVYGQHQPHSVPQTVSFQRPWAKSVRNRYLSAFGRSLVWQPVIGPTRGADLIIIEHATRLLANYLLHALRVAVRQRLAYWGHGRNFQASRPNGSVERVKRLLINHSDWWFAYTEMGKTLAEKGGFPSDRITVVVNAIDDTELRIGLQDITAEEIGQEKRRLGITGDRVALYCGGMYPDKRLDFLLAACERLRDLVPDLQVVFLGSGPQQQLVEAACGRHRWMHFIGPIFGARRALYFAMSQVLLMPGLVGLAIMDSFVAGVPLFTTDLAIHSPEIDYLKDGVNGIITRNTVEDYAVAVAHHLNHPAALAELRRGALESATAYTMDQMVKNFAHGVEACLTAEPR